MNIVKQDGLTALHHAVIGKREAVISHLLRKGSNPEAQDQVYYIYVCVVFVISSFYLVSRLRTFFCRHHRMGLRPFITLLK